MEVTPGLDMTTPPSVTTRKQVDILQGHCSNLSDLTFPPSNFSQFILEDFTIDWCQYRLRDGVDTSNNEAGDVASSPTSMTESPPRVIPSGRNSVTLVVIVVVVFVLVVMGASAAICVCFGRRRQS